MLERQYVFPGVIEMNVQARRRLGVNIYLIDGGSEYALIDVGFLDELGEVLELIRQMNFSLSACKLVVATHADPPTPRDAVLARLARLTTSGQFLFGQQHATLWGMYLDGGLVSTGAWFDATARAG